MSHITDRDYLQKDQYRDSSNLLARVRLHLLYSANAYGWSRWLFDHIELPQDGQVLEVGCGPGGLWRQNLARMDESWRICLTDLSLGMVQEARRNLEASANFTYAQADAGMLPFGSNSFDAVFAMHMLYHVPDRVDTLREIKRVLKPGGPLYASTIGENHLKELRDLLASYSPSAVGRAAFGVPGEEAAIKFSLEHGAEELAIVFGQVDKYLYEDSLRVTEAEPLVDYILSTRSAQEAQEKRPGLIKIVQAELDRQGGVMPITKSSGLFIAHNPV